LAAGLGTRSAAESYWYTRLFDASSSVHYRVAMTRYGAQYGPDVTFLGVDRCDLEDEST
jgi:hypothetical protein